MLSACNSEDDKVLGLEMGADDYLSKPFGVKELVARCRKLLRQPFNQVSRSSVLQFRDIHLHLDEAKVVVRGEEVILPFKEFSLLRILMERPYRVWAREELITLIWGPDFDGNPKTLDVHICQLRKKLERNPDRPEYIVTVRGIGYRFGSSG
jgi:two-component system phosphate regulon response regulator PhoB